MGKAKKSQTPLSRIVVKMRKKRRTSIRQQIMQSGADMNQNCVRRPKRMRQTAKAVVNFVYRFGLLRSLQPSSKRVGIIPSGASLLTCVLFTLTAAVELSERLSQRLSERWRTQLTRLRLCLLCALPQMQLAVYCAAFASQGSKSRLGVEWPQWGETSRYRTAQRDTTRHGATCPRHGRDTS